jgi:hypothetical protein
LNTIPTTTPVGNNALVPFPTAGTNYGSSIASSNGAGTIFTVLISGEYFVSFRLVVEVSGTNETFALSENGSSVADTRMGVGSVGLLFPNIELSGRFLRNLNVSTTVSVINLSGTTVNVGSGSSSVIYLLFEKVS